MGGKKWSLQELEYLKTHYPNQDTKFIARMFERTVDAIEEMARKNGIKKSKEWFHKSRFGGVVLLCCVCGSEFECPKSEAHRRKTCSLKCSGILTSQRQKGENNPSWKSGKPVLKCEWCEKDFIAQDWRTESRFCSRECFGKWNSKENNPSWKGGISDEGYVGFTESLKKKIRERDNYLCVECGDYGSDVHHIDYDKTNSDESNLITLCHSCHAKTNVTNREYFSERYSLIM